ncbi:MAG: 3-deoxy-7-phosphoheptulonate synthase [Pseudanabaenaceae cyanobacterium]
MYSSLHVPQTSDLHVVETRPLSPPAQVKQEYPVTLGVAEVVSQARDRIRRIIWGEEQALLVVVGPCSIHDVMAAREYAQKLVQLRQELHPHLEIIMRVYFEKPRTTVGWKGLINDPYLDGSFDINTGIRWARHLLIDLASWGLPAATELLDPIIPQYLADLIAWTAIGARTTESQTHREMASGLSMPVGFKNGTDGNIDIAMNAMIAAQQTHHFLGINYDGIASIVTTTGNPDGHLVLRGGKKQPNYDRTHIQQVREKLRAKQLNDRVMVDCSHDNSRQDYRNQPKVIADLTEQILDQKIWGTAGIAGVMLESHLVEGKQPFPQPKEKLVYGQSITDSCISFETTAQVLRTLAAAVAKFQD